MLWLLCCGVLPALVCLVLACLVWCRAVGWLWATVPGVLGVVWCAWCGVLCLVCVICLV